MFIWHIERGIGTTIPGNLKHLVHKQSNIAFNVRFIRDGNVSYQSVGLCIDVVLQMERYSQFVVAQRNITN